MLQLFLHVPCYNHVTGIVHPYYSHITFFFAVSDNAHLVGRRTEDSITGGYTGRPSDRHSRTEMLPDFVSRLQQKGILDPREQAVERVCSIYTQARFRDGVRGLCIGSLKWTHFH